MNRSWVCHNGLRWTRCPARVCGGIYSLASCNGECSTSMWVYQTWYSEEGITAEPEKFLKPQSMQQPVCRSWFPKHQGICFFLHADWMHPKEPVGRSHPSFHFDHFPAHTMPNHNSGNIDRTPMIIDDAWLIMIQHFGCLLLVYSGSRKQVRSQSLQQSIHFRRDFLQERREEERRAAEHEATRAASGAWFQNMAFPPIMFFHLIHLHIL